MKLPITQIVLSTLVFVPACYITWWTITSANELLDSAVLDENGSWVQNYTPDNEILFSLSRYLSGVLALLGLVFAVTGILWERTENKIKLTNIQIITGVLIVVLSVIILIWGYSFSAIARFEGGPEITKTYSIELTLLTALLGMGVFIIGLILLKRARQYSNA
jgi:hypothetical protein